MKGSGIFHALSWAVFLATGPGRAASAEEPVVLLPKLIVGSESVTKVTRKTTMNVPRSGELTEQKVEANHQFMLTIEGHEDEASKKVRVEIDSVAIEVAMPGMVMRYDSTDPSTKDADLGSAFKGLVDNPVDMVYDEDDAFVKMADTDAFSEGGNAPFGQKIGREEMKQMVRSSIWEGFPREAVSPGDAWSTRVSMPIPGMGEAKFDLEYFYRGDRFIEDRFCAIVDLKGTMAEESLAPPAPDSPEAQSRAVDGIESGTISGVISIDKNLRLIVESDYSTEIVLRMPSPLGRERVTVPVKQEESRRVVTFRQLR